MTSSPPRKNVKRSEKNGSATGGCLPSVWNRLSKAQSPWPDKDEFLDVIYWGRQIIAIIFGLIWGITSVKGIIAILLFCAINAGVMYLYFSSFQQVDEEEFGGAWELTKEGFMTSFALFMVIWIITYTGLHWSL